MCFAFVCFALGVRLGLVAKFLWWVFVVCDGLGCLFSGDCCGLFVSCGCIVFGVVNSVVYWSPGIKMLTRFCLFGYVADGWTC